MRTPIPKRGDIWLLRFPFTDLSSSKVRPAIIISVHGEDLIVLGIFSRLPSATVRNTWVILVLGKNMLGTYGESLVASSLCGDNWRDGATPLLLMQTSAECF